MKGEKFEIPCCPQCGKRLNVRECLSVHKLGEYSCPWCGYRSEITYQKRLKWYALIAFVVSLVITVVSVIAGEVNIFEFVLCIIPFLLFYFCIPYTMLLKKKDQRIVQEKEKDKEKKRTENEIIRIYEEKANGEQKKIKENPMDYDDIDVTRVF